MPVDEPDWEQFRFGPYDSVRTDLQRLLAFVDAFIDWRKRVNEEEET